MAHEELTGAASYPDTWWKAAPAEPPVYEVPHRPHMPERAAAWLEAQLGESRCLLEYGMGGSTFLAAGTGVADIVSVESDARFAKAVRKEIESAGFKSRLHLVSADIGPTGKWGVPMSFKMFRRWPSYALDVWEHVREKGLAPDFILIDGRFRVGCFFASLMEAPAGTTIMFDDYLSRRQVYSVVEQFLAPAELIDRAAIFTVPDSVPLRNLAFALARYVSRPG